jgi:hypothetical protein
MLMESIDLPGVADGLSGGDHCLSRVYAARGDAPVSSLQACPRPWLECDVNT